jgi:hypothetical protein
MVVCLVWCCALSWTLGTCLADDAAPAKPSDQPSILVLHDGGVLVGTISRTADRYLVSRAGSEIQVPIASVLTTCNSLQEAYEHRREKMSRPTVNAHLALAEWSLRYGLLPQAARELLDARGLEPLHPRLKLLERRLMAASQPRSPKQDIVVAATHEEPINTNANAADSDTMFAADLPKEAIERFTRKVQPILVNNCTLSGCHQPGGEQPFQLDRALLHGLANRRSTMKNLAATLALVNREQPHLSPLLTVPRRSHGGMQSPVIGPRQQVAFNHLGDWVKLVTPPTSEEQDVLPPGEPDAASLDTGSSPQAPPRNATIDASSDVAQAHYLEDADIASPKRKAIRYGARLQAWQPKDPFDPEIFNRQQQPQIESSGTAESGTATEND